MFEKEAETTFKKKATKIAEKKVKEFYKECGWEDYKYMIPEFAEVCAIGMRKGAEFGYNRAVNNRTTEWHYIKNGDYPKDTKTVLALCIVGGEPYPYLAQYWKGSTTAKKNGVDLNWNCWLNNMQREVVEPYAWREITIPELGLQMSMQEG